MTVTILFFYILALENKFKKKKKIKLNNKSFI